MVPSSQWLIRGGCLALIALGTLIQIVAITSPYWILDQARPSAYPAFLQLLKQAGGVDLNITQSSWKPPAGNDSESSEGAYIVRAGADVGLWKWCVVVEVEARSTGKEGGPRSSYKACHTPAASDFPGWWKGCQATAVVGTLMGLLACVCGCLEMHYLRHGVRFSGLIVLCSIACFVAALGMGVSHGMFGSRYTTTLVTILRLPSNPGWPGVYSLYPPVLGWAFGVGAAAAVLICSVGLCLLALITRTYPTYQRTENVVV